MTIEKINGAYTITDGRVFKDLSPLAVLDYVRNFLIGDATDTATLEIQNIHPLEMPTRRIEYATRRTNLDEGRIR